MHKTSRNITELGLKKCNSKLFPVDTIFITARGTVGICVLTAVPMAMSQTSYALIGRNKLHQYYYFLIVLDMIKTLRKNATGAVFETIIVDTFRKQQIIVPTNKIIAAFIEIINPIFQTIKNLHIMNYNLKEARDLLLPRLMNGEIAV